MKNGCVKLILRLLFVPASAFFAFTIISIFVTAANDISFTLTTGSYNAFFRFDTRDTVVMCLFVSFLLAHISTEVAAFIRPQLNSSRLLKNLRYGPIAVFVIFRVTVISLDTVLIEASKYQIRDYVYNGSDSLNGPEFSLHNDDRGWCGNGASAREKDLYFQTAAAGLHDPDPYVRARSLKVSARVRDFLNGGNADFESAVSEACSDENEIVRRTAESLSTRSSCRPQKTPAK